MPAYLAQLMLRLAAGMGELPDAFRQRHTRYLLAAQRPEGGFAGREGECDLYYTSFGLRGLALLGQLYGPPAERAAHFLTTRLSQYETVLDLVSLIYGASLLQSAAGIDVLAAAPPDWTDKVDATLTQLRRPDGGYSKTNEGYASSTYHSFLVLLCLQLRERPVADHAALVRFLLSQRGEDGGFREIRVAKRSGTNPTAAAIGALKILDAVSQEVRQGAIRFLAAMQTPEGGLRANSRIPLADLLSTLTGLLSLTDLDAGHCVDSRAVARFTQSLELPDGGFRAAAWDEFPDAEYTFYGLGCQALLASPRWPPNQE